MFTSYADNLLESEYLNEGYIIRPVSSSNNLLLMKKEISKIVCEILEIDLVDDVDQLLNDIHKVVSVEKLNPFRVKIIKHINSLDAFREGYFQMAKPYLEALVGNELAMQLRINLSIQMPEDDGSLLPIHADTWSGDSPYEVVAWIPLVDCYRTKSMYIVPPSAYEQIKNDFAKYAGDSSEHLYQAIKSKVKWLDVKFGEVLIFNQALPHGNRINKESETRWSMNCRFKGVFTPYGDKKIGEFFEPITLKPASRNGLAYKLPKLT